MGVSSSQLQPQGWITFKKLSTNVPLDNIHIPERPENRRPTNAKWLIVFGIFVAILLPFMTYTLCYANGRRIIPGYDNCGNVCGQKNYQWDNIPCSGQNWINEPYLQYDEETMFHDRRCVQSCNTGYAPISGRCLRYKQEYGFDSNPGSDVQKVKFDESVDFGIYFNDVKWHISISCLLSIWVAIGMLFLFRYAVAFVVWGILIGCFIVVLICVAFFWYFLVLASEEPSESNHNSNKGSSQLVAILFTIFAIFLGFLLIWYKKKVRLVILLLKEATLAVFDMPGLIAVPVVCLVAVLILTFFFCLTTFYMASAGFLEHVTDDFYRYATTPVMIFTMCFNFVVYICFAHFFTGIQYMIIAGAVSKWYFARDKSFLGSPIITSMSNTFRFHLGTVALGSLIITLVQVIKSIILGLLRDERVKIFVQYCIESLETFFNFLSKNAFIITAMHGQAFIESGKRAAKLIIQNIGDIIAINYIGDFVLGMAKFLIVVISVLLSMGIFAIEPGSFPNNNIFAYLIVAVVSTIVACITFGVFETTIDTLFICYCEDSILNDGMARPYFMSRNMMEFVQNSKKIYAK